MSTDTLYYDRYWTPEGFLPHGRPFPELERFITERGSVGQAWLDVGCGDGMTSGPTIRATGAAYTGVDVSRAGVDRAREAGLDVMLIPDSGEMPIAGATFDFAVCVEVMEHLFAPQETAREILRVLKPGGTLFATVPNATYWRRRAEAVVGRFDPIGDDLSLQEPWRDPHIRFFTAKTLKRMLEAQGFTNVQVGGHAGKWVQDWPKVGPRLTAGNSAAYRALEQRFPGLLGKRLNVTAHKP